MRAYLIAVILFSASFVGGDSIHTELQLVDCKENDFQESPYSNTDYTIGECELLDYENTKPNGYKKNKVAAQNEQKGENKDSKQEKEE